MTDLQPAIRRAGAGDAGVLAPLFEAYRRFFTGHADPARSHRFLSERLANGDSAVFGAFDRSGACGFLQLYPLFSSWYAKRQWFLSDLYVADAARRSGVGARLVEAAVDFAVRDGARSILVELPFSQPHLTRFYARFGFEKDPVFELYRRTIG